MKKTIHFILKDVIFASIINVYSPVILSVVLGVVRLKYITNEKIEINNILNILISIPGRIWVILIVGILIWYLLIFLYSKITAVRSLNRESHSVKSVPNPIRRKMMLKVGEIEYNSVVWYIFGDTFTRTTIGYINADIPPRCPKCKTKLEQKHGLMKKYVWKCVECNYKKRSNSDFYENAIKVKKIAERRIERKHEGNKNYL